jgi:predicted signal transduction protein with EAL and GGDEF domain
VVRNSFRTKEDLAKERAPDLLTQSTSRRGDLLAASIEGKYVVIKPGRIGGDEFAALCHTDENGAEVIAKRIKSLFQEALSDELKGIGVDISVGFSSLSPGMTASSFLKKADEMLYRDKESHIPNLNDEQQMIIRGIAVALREMKVQPRHIPKYLALYAAKELGNNPVA